MIEIDGHAIQIPAGAPSKEAVHLAKAGGENGTWIRVEQAPRGIVKRPGLQGPVDDAFLSSFLVVLPGKKSVSPAVERWVHFELQHFLHRWKTLYRATPKMKYDKDISEEDLRNNHLIAFGDTTSNTLLKRIMEQQNTLPIEWDKESLMIKGEQYDATSHVPVLIYPNPLNT